MNPYIFEYKSIALSWFMFLTIISIWLGYRFVAKELAEELSGDKVEGLTMKVVIMGLIGSRLYYALEHWELYQDHLFSIIQISPLTLDFKGALIVGGLVLYLFSKKEKVGFKKILDSYAQATTLGLVIGVWSYYFNNISSYLETLLLSIVLLVLFYLQGMIKSKSEKDGNLFWIFIIFYLVFNFIIL